MGDPSGKTRLDLTLGEDSDGDGMSNLEEFISGNYAFDENDGLRLEIVEINDQGPVFEFLAVRGRSYELCGAAQLNEWRPVEMSIAGVDDNQTSWLAPESKIVRIEATLDPELPVPQFFKLLAQ